MRYWLTILLIAGFYSGSAFGHGGADHEPKFPKPDGESAPPHAQELGKINTAYRETVKPIFEKKCFDCHSQQTRYPWYHKIPGLNLMLDRDIAEGRKHLDMSNDFPFSGHGTPLSDLRAIEKAVREGTMPLFRYRFLHPDSRLNDKEKERVLRWVEESSQRLNAPQEK